VGFGGSCYQPVTTRSRRFGVSGQRPTIREVKSTVYFQTRVLRDRPYFVEVWAEWARAAIAAPVEREIEPSGRVRHWIEVEHPEFGARVLRVVTLEDGNTVHTMFFDRDARVRWEQEGRP
jgi:hypothetical protein